MHGLFLLLGDAVAVQMESINVWMAELIRGSNIQLQIQYFNQELSVWENKMCAILQCGLFVLSVDWMSGYRFCVVVVLVY